MSVLIHDPHEGIDMTPSKPLPSIVLVILLLSFLNACSPEKLYVSPGGFYLEGELAVRVMSITDSTAPVEMDIYTPLLPGRYPLVVFQHGFTGSIKGYETIATHLASHGFVVVLPQMYPPGDFVNAPTPEEEAKTGLEVVTWLDQNINTIIPVTADTSLLGLVGHSRGGQIAYRMALKLPGRINALAGVDPVDGLELFGQTPVITAPLDFEIPTYILGTGLGPEEVEGEEFNLSCAPEEIGPYHFYQANPSPSWLIIALLNGHADMIDEEDYTAFCPGGPDRNGMRTLTAGTLAAFFSAELQGSTTAIALLSDSTSAPVPVSVDMK